MPNLPTEIPRRQPALALEKVAEMRPIGKAEAIGDFGDIPARLLEQDFGFLPHAAANEGGRGKARGFL